MQRTLPGRSPWRLNMLPRHQPKALIVGLPGAPEPQLRVPEACMVTDAGLEALEGLTGLVELDASCRTVSWRAERQLGGGAGGWEVPACPL